MLSAVRRGRRELGRPRVEQPGNQSDACARLPDLSQHCRQFANNAARAAGNLGAQLAGAAARAVAPLLAAADIRPQFDAQQPAHSQLLLASVSSSTLGEPQKAFLPRRAGGGGGSGGGDSGSGGGGDDGGAKDLLADADENERFLISEVGGLGVCRTDALSRKSRGRGDH